MAYIGGIAYKLAADYTISEQAANKIASNISVILAVSYTHLTLPTIA